MKLYDTKTAPNPRRVRIFLAEKGVEVPTVQIDIAAGENRRSPYIDKNPLGGGPMLELDDGTIIAESVAIVSKHALNDDQNSNPPSPVTQSGTMPALICATKSAST